MTLSCKPIQVASAVLLAVLLAMGVALAGAATPLQLLEELNAFPHSRTVNQVEENVLDYEIGLGAMQKVSGAWRFKHSERFDGTLTSYTWQIVDGFTSLEVLAGLEQRVGEVDGARLLFSCEGRACGQGVQWANRVFHQPLLYGREELQRYRVYAFGDEPRYLLVVYAAARTADRQYLHAEVLATSPDG